MKSKGISRANQNRAIQQEALREKLSAGGHIDHVIDIAKQLVDLDKELDSVQVQRLKAAADIKKGLIAKYLPDLKQVELTGELQISDMTEMQIDERIKQLQELTDE